MKKANKIILYEPFFIKGYMPFVWIVAIGFILYFQSLSFDYTYLDDNNLVLNNLQNFKHFSTSIIQAFKKDVFNSFSSASFYRPLLTVSFIIDANIGGGKLAFFHFTNILFHILSCCLVYLLFIELKYDKTKSLISAIIFNVHPAFASVVSWIPGRNDSLLAIFLIISMIYFIRYLNNGLYKHYFIHLLFFIFSLFIKELGIILIAICTFYFFYISKSKPTNYLKLLAVWLPVTLLWIYIRHVVLSHSFYFTVTEMTDNIFKSLPALITYLNNCFLPFKLSVFPVMKDIMLRLIMGVFVILVLFILFYRTSNKRLSFIFFGILWYILFLLPSFISQISKQMIFSDHRLYIPFIGILLLLMECTPFKNIDFGKKKIQIISVCIIIILFVMSFIHSRDYKDRYSFWKNAVKTSPSNAFSYNNLGAMYYLDKNISEAEKYFRKAVEINPDEPLANSNLGLVCMNTGRMDEAEKYYLKEIQVNPKYDNVYYNIGILYYNENRTNEAIGNFEKAIEVNPEFIKVYEILIQYYQSVNDNINLNRILIKAKNNNIRF